MDVSHIDTPIERRAAWSGGDRRAVGPRTRFAFLAAVPSRRAQGILIGGLLVVMLAVYAAGLHGFQVGTFFDDAHYVTLARALVQGRGYTLINYPDAPPELKFPPGYPLLLTPVALLSPRSLDAFKIPSILLTLASLPLWFVLFRRRLPFWLAYLALAAVATNPSMVGDATLVMSEAAFLFFTALLFVLADGDTAGKQPSWYRSVGIAAALIALYFTRTVGIVFVGAAILYLLGTRRFQHAIVIAALFAVPFAFWTYYSVRVGVGPLSPQYQQEFVASDLPARRMTGLPSLLNRAALNAESYAIYAVPNYLRLDPGGAQATQTARTFLEMIHAAWLRDVARFGVPLLAALGLLRALRERQGFVEAATVLYFAALVLWPWSVSRYVDPVGPLVYLFFILGVITLISALLTRGVKSLSSRGGVLVACFIGALVLMNLAIDVHGIRTPVRDRITDISIGAAWIAQNAPEHSVAMGEFAVPQSLYTERPTVDFPSPKSVTS
ncbi:MAG TPA: glycosyltransferase family 39 protein, partial [Chloroflexota bacterium]|nr:glycosyltransferase family 39 protein [Chloroflexota bacterium]